LYLILYPLYLTRTNTMKHNYSLKSNALRWLCLCLLVALPGLGSAQAITANPTSLVFGNQATNAASSPQPVTVMGTGLTADVAVTAPAGFLVSDGGVYATSVTLPQTNGAVNATVNVVFQPAAVQSYGGNVVLASTGASSQSVAVSGTGVVPTPTLNVSATALPDFGQVAVGTTGSTAASFNVGGQGLQGNVTVRPPVGFLIRTGANAFSTSAVVLTPTGGVLASTPIDVAFEPTAVQQYNTTVSVTTLNVSTKRVAVTGEGTASASAPNVVLTPGALNFGAVTGSGSTGMLAFDVSGNNLTSDIVLTPGKSTIQLRIQNATTPGVFSSSPITLAQTNGTVAPQTIEVRLVAAVPQGNYNEQVAVTSGTVASAVSVTATNNSGAKSDISVFSPSVNDFTLAARPNTVSPSQTFLVAATNLLQNLTVAPEGPNAALFKVSIDNTTFSPQLSFAPDAQGNVTQKTIYVRFEPGNSAVTVDAIVGSSSSPAPTSNVSVTGISTPTIRLSQAIGSFPYNTVVGTKSASSAVRLDGFLLTGDVAFRFPDDLSASNPTHTPQYEFSLNNGSTYLKTSTVSPDANGSFSQNLLVRFAPVRVGNANQVLEFSNAAYSGNTNYFQLGSGFGSASGFAIATEPTAQSTATVTRAAGSASAIIAFNSLSTPPADKAYGQNRLVIASPTYLRLPTSLFPQDRQNFNPGTTLGGAYQFGTGSATESSSNTYVVFSGSSDTFTVAGLDPSLTYYFFAFEFNNEGVLNAENYLLPNNQAQVPLPVELVAFTAQRQGQQVNLSWATASERDCRSFDVERSADGYQFQAILSKAGQGNSNARTHYTAVDHRPLPGLSYYRLKQLDINGAAAYSPMVTVQSDGAVALSLYPNPTAGKLTIGLSRTLADRAPRVRISDLTGRVVQELPLPATGEVDLSALPAGTYLVSVGGQQVRSRVVKY